MRFAVVLLFACTASTSTSVALLDPDALAPTPADRDAFADHRPAVVQCPPATWGPESGSFEVQTGACNYAAFDQPLDHSIRMGDELAIIIWHDFLDAPEPATAHVGISLDGRRVWETEFAIPAQSRSIEVTVPITFEPSSDARLGIHLHNHGFNSWRFVAVDRLR